MTTAARLTEPRRARRTHRAEVVACLGPLAVCVFTASVVGCSASSAHPPVMYATGQITDLAARRIDTDLGTLNGIHRGAVLLVFEVAEEQVDAGTGGLVRVRLAPLGVVGVLDASLGGSVALAGAGAEAMRVGHYVRLVDPEAISDAPWWEGASAWWRSISNRDAIVGTDRTLPFYRGKSKRNRAD